MIETLLSDRIQQLIIHINDNGFTTRKQQNIYDSNLGFYLIMWKLRDSNIIYANGEKHKNQKVWRLTEKGGKIAALLKKINKLMSDTKICN